MAKLPRTSAQELIANTGIETQPNAGAGFAALAHATGGIAADMAEEDRREARVAEAAYVAQVEVDNRIALAELRAETPDDPAAYKAKARAHVAGVVSQVPDHLRDRLKPSLESTAASNYTALLNQKAQADRVLQHDALTANADASLAEWQGLADSGNGAGDTAMTARGRYAESLAAQVEGGFISQERADALIALKDSEAMGRSYLAANRITFAEQGFASAWAELNELATDERIDPRVRSKLVNEQQSFLREQVAAESRAQTLAGRGVGDREDATAKAGWTLWSEGGLTAGWVVQNQANLSKADYKALLDATTKPDTRQDEPDAYADLLRRSQNGEDIADDAYRFHAMGRITNSTLRTFTESARKERDQGMPKPVADRARKYLSDQLDPGPFVKDPAGKARYAEAVKAYDDWLDAAEPDKPRTDKEIWEFADQTIERFGLIDWREKTSILPLPRYFVGNRNAPNIEATEAALAKALKEGTLTREDFNREAQIIERWREALARKGAK